MWNPAACQMDRAMMAGMAVAGSLSQSGPWMRPKLKVDSNSLIRPSLRYMNSHSRETTTMDVTTGRK